jgi:MFS family permease
MITKNITLLKWYNFFYEFRPYGAIAILYFTQVTGSFALGLAVFSIASIAAAVFEIPTGVVSDKIGRRKTIIFGSVASVITLALYALGGSFGFTLLVLGAVFNGLTRALLSGNNDALLYDTMKQAGQSDQFSEKLGKVNSMFEVALGISALLGGALALISLQAVMIVSILPQAICAIIALRFIEPKVHTDEVSENIYSHLSDAIKGFVRNAKLRKLSLAYSLDYALEETQYNFKPAFAATLLPTWMLGIVRSLDNLFGFLGYHFAGIITKRFGALKTLLGQQIIGRLNIFVAAGIPTVISPFLLNINAFFFGIGETANRSLMQKEFTDKQRATMGSLNSLLGSLLFAVVAFLVGLVADSIGPAKTILMLGVASISVVLIYWNLFKNHND